MATVTIRGVTYQIIKRETPEGFQARGLHNIARIMIGDRCSAQLHLRRLLGRVFYSCREFQTERGTHYTEPMRIF